MSNSESYLNVVCYNPSCLEGWTVDRCYILVVISHRISNVTDDFKSVDVHEALVSLSVDQCNCNPEICKL